MTVAVDWDVNHQTKQAKPIVLSGVSSGRGLRISTQWVYQGCSKYSKISNTSLIQKGIDKQSILRSDCL